MRESLTVLAILLILVLSAALAVPYFVDWNAERGLVEAQLSEMLGRPVKVRGAIDLKLLPTPYLMLADVQVGSAAAEPEIKIDEIQLEIALTALLHGEVDFVEARLVRPQLALQIADESAPIGPSIHWFSGQMRFERISIANGALTLHDRATGRTYVFNHISLGAEAAALAGPYKAQGHFTFAGQPTSFNFAAGDRTGNRQRFKLIIDETRQHPRADLDASLIFPQSRAGIGLPSVDGTVTLSGHIEAEIALPWRLSGTLQGGLHKAAINDLDLRLGDEDHAVDFAGTAEFDLGATPRANVTLKAHQLDLDRLLAVRGGPTAMQRLAHALADLVQSHDLMASNMPVALAWSADAAVLGGETLSGLSGGFSVADKEAAWLRFAADGPGRSHLLLDGDIETGTAAGFKGRMEASAADVPRLAQWLGENLPQDAAVFKTLPIHAFDLAGTANFSRIGFVGRNLSLSLDQSMLTGTVAYTQSVGGEPARLFADVSASKVALDSAPDLSRLVGAAKRLDLSLRLDARAVKIGGIGQNGLDTGKIVLNLDKTGPLVKLARFAVTGVGGADLTAHGQWDGKSGTIAAAIDSARFESTAALLQRLAPGAASAALLARAGDLSPVHLTLNAQAETTQKGTPALTEFNLTGSAGGTKIAAKIATSSVTPPDLVVSASLDAPDALVLIRQIGLPALPLPGLGAGRVAITAHGGHGKPFDTDLTASLPGATLGFQGAVAAQLAAPHATGRLTLAGADLTPLLEATGVAFPGPSLQLSSDLAADVDAGATHVSLRNMSGRFAGTQIGGQLAYDAKADRLSGALNADRLSLASILDLALGQAAGPKSGLLWSTGKFPAAIIAPPPTALTVTAKTLDLTPQVAGRDARLGLEISGDRAGLKLGLRHFSMQLASGTAAGDLTLRRDGAMAAVAGHVRLSNYALALPSAQGSLSADLDLAGTGDSAAAIIAGLAGSGTFRFADLVLPRSDPAAMARVFKAVEEDSLGLDTAEIDRALTTELDKGAARLGDMAFDASLAGGLLRLTPKPPGAPKTEAGVTETAQASLDLGTLTLDQKTGFSLVALPKNWSGPPPSITLLAKGDVSHPQRTIESASFVNALAARAIARESARIQAQEFDVHEQAFFYNRLKSERARAQEKLKAEADAKAAQIRKAAAAAEAAGAKAEADKLNAEAAAQAARAKVEAERLKAEAAGREAAPLPIERPLRLRPAPRRPRATPLTIVRQPPPQQRPAPEARPWGAPTDPLAAGRY